MSADTFPGDTISGTSGTVSVVATGYTREVGEPFTFGQTNLTAWFTWVAPINAGDVAFNTGGSTINDTVLGIFTGDSVGSLTLVGSNDDGYGNLKSIVTFAPVAGTTYHIQVGDYGSGNSGAYTLNWAYVTAALNVDTFPGLPISGSAGQVSDSATTLGRQAGEPFTYGQTNQTAWYTWVAPYGTVVSFDTIGSGVNDTVLGIFTGDSVGSLTLIGKDDDSAGGLKSIVSFAPTVGVTYHIQVGNYSSGLSNGLYVLNWYQESPPQATLHVNEFSHGPRLGSYSIQTRLVMPFFGFIDIRHYKINPNSIYPCGVRKVLPPGPMAFDSAAYFSTASYVAPQNEDAVQWFTIQDIAYQFDEIVLELTQGFNGFTGGVPYTTNGDHAQNIRQIEGRNPNAGGTDTRTWIIDWEDLSYNSPPLDARTWVRAVAHP